MQPIVAVHDIRSAIDLLCVRQTASAYACWALCTDGPDGARATFECGDWRGNAGIVASFCNGHGRLGAASLFFYLMLSSLSTRLDWPITKYWALYA